MGTYDTIHYKCPHCNKISEAQTKLNTDDMLLLRRGDKFDFQDCILLLKNPCHLCKNHAAMVIKNKTIRKFIRGDKATMKETSFGGFEEVKRDTSDT